MWKTIKDAKVISKNIDINFLLSEVERKITEIKHTQEREQTVEDNVQKFIKLRAEYTKNPSFSDNLIFSK